MREVAETAVRDNGLERVVFLSTDIINPGQGRFAKALRIPAVSMISSPAYYHSSQDVPEHLKLEDYQQALNAYRDMVADLLMEDRIALKKLEKHKADSGMKRNVFDTPS